MPQIVCLAGLLADLVVDDRQDVLPQLMALGADHHLTSAALTALVSTLQEKVDQLADVLSLALPAGCSYTDVLARAQIQMTESAAEGAAALLRAARSPAQVADEEVEQQLDELSTTVNQFLHRPETTQLFSHEAAPHPVPRGAATPSGTKLESRGLKLRRVPILTAWYWKDWRRQSRTAVSRGAPSLALVEVDHFEHWLLSVGPAELQSLMGRVAAACRAWDVRGLVALQVRPQRLAIILPASDRTLVVGLAKQLVLNAASLAPLARAGKNPPLGLSVGVATVSQPPKNFSPVDLLESAARCLAAAQTSGNCCKSIGIY